MRIRYWSSDVCSSDLVDCGDGRIRIEIVVEGIRPQNDARAALVPRLAVPMSRGEGLPREGRQPPLRRNAAQPFRERAYAGPLRNGVGEVRHMRGESAPPVDQAHGVGFSRAQMPCGIMREELGLRSEEHT